MKYFKNMSLLKIEMKGIVSKDEDQTVEKRRTSIVYFVSNFFNSEMSEENYPIESTGDKDIFTLNYSKMLNPILLS